MGRKASALRVMVSPLIATGPSQADARMEREKARQLLAFLYSTPVYWPTLELYGWKDRGEHLHQLSRDTRWSEMVALVSDEMLDVLVPTAPYSEIADVLKEWYGPHTGWIAFPMPTDATHDREVAKVVAQLRQG